MPQSFQITVPPDRTDQLVPDIQSLSGVISLRVQRSISLKPPGDLVSVTMLSRDTSSLMQLLDRQGVTTGQDCSIETSQPMGVISTKYEREITNDTSEVTWEDMDLVLSKESTGTWNKQGFMFGAGAAAAAGIVTGGLHLVIGAMIVAPVFLPLSRLALGVVGGQGRAVVDGLKDTLILYLAFLAGVVVSSLAMVGLGFDLIPGSSAYIEAGELVKYWTSISWLSVIVSTGASLVGALLIATNRTVLVAGVVIILALVPAWTIFGVALVAGDWVTLWNAFQRWALDVGLVVLLSLLVFAWKRARIHRRTLKM